MQVKELKKDGLKHEMEVTLTAQDIDRRIDIRLQEVGKTINLPGFRKGKVPLQILKKKYGKAVMGEVLETAVNESSAKALKDKDLKPALQPKIEVKSFNEGKDLTFTMAVEVMPTFEVTNFRGITLQKLVSTPGDKDIDEAIGKIAAGRRSSKPVESKRGAKKGDIVVMDFHGRTADDNVAHEGMHAHGYQLELGSGSFIPGFEDQLIGVKAGEKTEVKVTFPKDYGAAELAGRDAIFDIDVKELREPSEVTLDDDLAKSFGMADLEALRKAVTEQLQREFDYHSRLYLKKTLMDHLDKNHDFGIPEGMLELEFGNIMKQVEGGPKNAKKATEEEKSEYRGIAERRVRLGLILAEIGNTNGITVSDQELQRAVIAEAQRYPGQERQVFDFYSKNRNALESLRAPAFEEKVVDFILDLAKLTEKTVSPEDLVNAIESEEEELKKSKSPAKKAAASEGKSKSRTKKANS